MRSAASTGATLVDYHAVTDYQLMSMGMNAAIVEVQACDAVVDKKTNKVISAYQDEELNTYTGMAQNMVNTDSSVKMFSVKGKPLFLTRAVSLETESRSLCSHHAAAEPGGD